MRDLIDPQLLLSQTVNFLILVFLLQRFLYKPVRKFLDDRTAIIENQLKSAKDQQEAAENMRLDFEAKLVEGKTQAKEYLEQAMRRSEQMHEELVEKAKQEAATIQKRSLEELAREKEKVRYELKEDVIQLSFAIASKIMKESLDQQKHQDLIKEAIAKIDQQDLGGLQ